MGKRDLARPRACAPAADEGRHARRMMRRPERARAADTPARKVCSEAADHAHFQHLGRLQRRQQRGEAFRQHGFPRSRRPDHQSHLIAGANARGPERKNHLGRGQSGKFARPEAVKPMQIKLPFHIVDLAAEELRAASGERAELRPRSFAVLKLLAANAGHVVSKDQIIETVWGNVFVTEDSLTQCITEIRKAIGDADKRVLRTVHGRGYLLVPSQRELLPGRAPDRPSLAVMPFLSLGGDDSLGKGVALEILGALARDKDLRLIARDSSFALANQNLVAQELGEQLGVRYLIEGTAQRSDGTLLVDVQLVDTRDGSIAWGDRFSAAAETIPNVRREIADKIAGSLHSGMRETEKQAALGA